MSETIVYFGSPLKDETWVDFPEKLIKFREDLIFGDRRPNDFLNKCPAHVDIFRNTFVITYPFEYSYSWTDSGISSKMYNQDFFDKNFTIRNASLGYLSLERPKLYFFSEEDIEMEFIKAYHHDNDFVNKTNFIEGVFNISKHFRPLEYPHIFKQKDTEISLSRGDAIAYVRFRTNKKVILKQFAVTDEMLYMSLKILKLRSLSSSVRLFAKPLDFYYNIFEKHKLKNFYLKQIKNNLME